MSNFSGNMSISSVSRLQSLSLSTELHWQNLAMAMVALPEVMVAHLEGIVARLECMVATPVGMVAILGGIVARLEVMAFLLEGMASHLEGMVVLTLGMVALPEGMEALLGGMVATEATATMGRGLLSQQPLLMPAMVMEA